MLKQWANVVEAFNGYAFGFTEYIDDKRNEKSILDMSDLVVVLHRICICR